MCPPPSREPADQRPSFVRSLALAVSLLAVSSAGPITAQQPIGWRSAALTPGDESKSEPLKALVYYPAAPDQRGERKVAIAETVDGFPVIVFLHGLGARGSTMRGIGQHLAKHGYVVVLTDTTRTDRAKQARNARRFFAALERENQRSESFFAGTLDMTRAGLGGHSMGGGNTVRVLADNPGYKAGFCFAPWTTATPSFGNNPDYVDEFADDIDVPLAIVHGVKDRVLPWKRNAKRLYDALDSDSPKVFWVLDERASHVNVAIPLPRFGPKNGVVRPTFSRCVEMATAFFDQYVKGDTKALQSFVDPKDKPDGVLELHYEPASTRRDR